MPIQAWPGGRHGDHLHRWFQMTHISIGGIESPPRGNLYDCVDLDLGLGPNEVVDAETRASEVRKIAQVGGRSRSTVSSSSTHQQIRENAVMSCDKLHFHTMVTISSIRCRLHITPCEAR